MLQAHMNKVDSDFESEYESSENMDEPKKRIVEEKRPAMKEKKSAYPDLPEGNKTKKNTAYPDLPDARKKKREKIVPS